MHDLYARYPDFFLSLTYEQALLREHDVIVFSIPFTPIAVRTERMKRSRFESGFASGRGNQLVGKVLAA